MPRRIPLLFVLMTLAIPAAGADINVAFDPAKLTF